MQFCNHVTKDPIFNKMNQIFSWKIQVFEKNIRAPRNL